jgi:hypothetical protein
MAICVHIVNVNGSNVLAQSPVSLSSCTDYVLQTSTDYLANIIPFTLTDITLMAWGVVGVWVVAFSIKVIHPLLR